MSSIGTKLTFVYRGTPDNDTKNPREPSVIASFDQFSSQQTVWGWDTSKGVCTGQRLQLAMCKENSPLEDGCSQFCKYADKCATFFNDGDPDGKHTAAAGANHVCTTDFSHEQNKEVKICMPNALLNDKNLLVKTLMKHGEPCEPSLCDWMSASRCATDNTPSRVDAINPLPRRENDGSFEYTACCG